MANATFRQNSFATGKLSLDAYGRDDLTRYYSGLSECENFVTTQQGPLVRRPGTRFVAQANGTLTKRLIPFQFSTDQTYQLEFGERYVRFYRDRDQIMDDGSLRSAGTSSTPFEITSPYTDRPETASEHTDVTTIASASIGINSFDSGASASSDAVPDGVARVGLASAPDAFVGMRVEIQLVEMANKADSRLVNRTHTVYQINDTPDSIDIFLPGFLGSAVATTGAVLFIPAQAVVAPASSLATKTGDLIRISGAKETFGSVSRPEYNGCVRMTERVSIDDISYPIGTAGGTCDSLFISRTNTSVSQIYYEQSADVLFLRHPNERPKELQRITGYSISDSHYTSFGLGTITLTIASEASPHPFQSEDNILGIHSSIIVSGCVPTGYNGTYKVIAVTPKTVTYTKTGGDPGALTTYGSVEGWQIVNSDDFDGPYEKEFIDETKKDKAPDIDVTLQSSLGAGGVQSSANDLVDSTIIQAIGKSDIGRVIASKKNTTNDWGHGVIETYESFATTPVAGFYVRRSEKRPFEAITSASENNSWKLGKWSDFNGWPWTVAFMQGRLASGGSNSYPSNFWASVSNDINNHRPFAFESPYEVSASDAIDVSIDDSKVNAIYWMANTANGMIVGTDSGEYLFKQTSTAEPLGPNNIESRNQTSIGSKRHVKPVRVGSSNILFVNKTGRKIYDISINPDTLDSFTSKDLSLLSGSLTESGIGGIAYAQDPYPIVWSYLDNGKLVGLTYDKSQDVIGWHEQTIAGTAVSGQDRARVLSVSTIHDTSGAESVSQVWMIVERNVNGTTEHHIEFMEDYYKTSDSLEDAVFMDGSVEYDGVSATAMTGLDHLENETVKVFADGVAQADQTVVSGAITIDTAATKVQMGLAMTSKMATLPIEYQNIRPEGVHKVKRAERLILDVMDCQGLEYGMSETDLYTVPLDDTTTLHTGIVGDMNLGACYGRDQRIWLVNSSVFPTTIRSLSAEVEYQPIED